MANSIKLEKPILVIMGNPPYSVSSSNKSEWIIKLMKDYKKDLKERNIQPLDDDYIKFIRFAQWKIEQNKIGMIGIISNNSYLDGVIHRQMRKEILSKFNSIYILNLHGDSRKGEKTPEGRKDENVFDIQQGVAIAIFVKNKGNEKAVHYVDLYGLRKDKYKFLQENKISEINFEDLNPKQPYYFLTQKDFSSKRKYDNFFKIDDIFNIGSSGVNTARDYLLVGFTKEEVSLRIESIKKENYNLLMKNLESDLRRNEVKDIFKTHKIDNNIFYNYDYRPFNI
ncbi:DNA methyltransferase, partial [Candidatus Woesearchaeota archaeon]|nr:DNA methyltransferase [Candidatus Woesearchaeota archaeon]